VLAAGVEDAITGAHVAAPVRAPDDHRPRVEITVTDDGYQPARVTIPRGQPVVLVFTRRSEKTCAVDVHFTLPNGAKVDERLPLGQPVEIPVEVDQPGEITYSCGMNMEHGAIDVR
jgi:plastocyanin domain-containing protein